MVNPLVERATSDLLVGPDWAKNAEICDILVHDPGQVKDVVKGIRRRIGSKSAKVQLLALTLLETLMNSCGDFVHMHVAERGVLRKMMKIAKRKHNYHVREKILTLIDNWQETFGPGSRYPQYYAAFYSLARAGIVFPRRSDRRTHILAPAQQHSYPFNSKNHDQQAPELPDDTDFPTLSMSEIQNALSIVGVLAEMLNSVEPGKEERVKQKVIIDLVQQCRTYKQRVVHLINSTTDESLLSQGLELNDDLQRLLAKHESIASVTSTETEPKHLQALIDIDDPAVITEDSTEQPGEKKSIANQSSIDPGIDLLSWEDIDAPTEENSLAIVQLGEPQESGPESQQSSIDENAFDPQSTYPKRQGFHSMPELNYEQSLHGALEAMYSDGQSALNMSSAQCHQQHQLVNGTQGGDYFPPPPWEIQSANDQQPQPMHPHYQQQDMQAHHAPQAMHPHYQQEMQVQHSHQVGLYAQSPPPNGQLSHMHIHQLAGMHEQMGMVVQGDNVYYQSVPNNSHFQYLEQRMYGLTMNDTNSAQNTQYQGQCASSSSYTQPSMRPKPEDKLFGDLVNMAKSKPKNLSIDSQKSV